MKVYYLYLKLPLLICFQMQGVSVEAVDPVFQAKMLDMLKQTGRLGFSLLTIKVRYNNSQVLLIFCPIIH